MPFLPASAPSSLGWINVKDHGARGDDATDDTAAIAAALSAIPATGGVLYFPAGTYVTTGGFTITKPTIIRGDGGFLDYLLVSTCSRITCTSSTAVLFTVHSRYAKFEDIALINTSGTTPTAGAGIKVEPSGFSDVGQKVDYNSITVSGFYANIDSQMGWGWVFSDSLISDPVQYGISIKNVNNPDGGNWCIDNCTFLAMNHSADAGIHVTGSGGGRISNCKWTWGLTPAHKFDKSFSLIPDASVVTSDILIDNCSFEDVGNYHIYINLATNNAIWQNIIIVGNQFYTATTSVIYIDGGTPPADGHRYVISDCTISGVTAADTAQIDLHNCKDVIIDNIVTDNIYATVSQTSCANILNKSHSIFAPPSVAAGANNGTSPPAPTLSSDSNDVKGQVNIGSGTTPAAGAQAVVSWGNHWGAAPKVFLTPLNAATVNLGLYVSSVTASGGFTISSVNAPAASQAATVYQAHYFVQE